MNGAKTPKRTCTPHPVIRLTKKQKQDIAGQLKGMTLAGAMALALKDEGRFKAINDRQQAIIQALGVLGIDVKEWKS
ncbi:MAG: hypothetical protein PHE17_15060 [Thiothrix sp.]|uniref:hypothetical protein n=1 Tax=Thiothrix sp. TaxID=1032 RepID=UPI002605336F|nr:hypothetical protein [Thiothrix sp.]MDD5394332.1 hypothetical protein [Thiothrix sp.]